MTTRISNIYFNILNIIYLSKLCMFTLKSAAAFELCDLPQLIHNRSLPMHSQYICDVLPHHRTQYMVHRKRKFLRILGIFVRTRVARPCDFIWNHYMTLWQSTLLVVCIVYCLKKWTSNKWRIFIKFCFLV
jgi:hypothetical protein